MKTSLLTGFFIAMKYLFARLPLMFKVALAPALVLVFLLVVTGYGIWTAQQSSATLNDLASQGIRHTVLTAQLQARVVSINALVMQSVAYSAAGLKADVIKALDEKLTSELKAAQEQMDKTRSIVGEGDADATERLEKVDKAFKIYTKGVLDTLDMRDADITAAAVLLSANETAYKEAQMLLEKQFQSEVNEAKVEADNAANGLSAGVNISVVLTLGALLLGIFLTWFIARQIVASLQTAMHIANDVASGNLALQKVRAGEDEAGRVVSALYDVSARLRAMIAGIRGSAHQINTAASEISQGNNDLASRTESTAMALQSTASAVGDLTRTLQLSSETASRASELAFDSSHIAQQGGMAVGEVISSMDVISTQAKRISEIIGTIDSIAFQTNILALNAAVEAARAGDQGRGFAVVASEVRSLAGRSAEAAKEIRTLISASVEQVELGTVKVQTAGETMDRIVSSIEQVSAMVLDISKAAVDQAQGIQRVNQAVLDMDRSTQQNAALVEQSAAAAEALRNQASSLVQAVSAFRIDASDQNANANQHWQPPLLH
ncbi:hypothetical protein KIK84_03765 [Curvibacter sp. CHRR-16]|uniref:methyl-accepting chemotaxis protein n=1 Tax=Curvibacter sp. CHRR-16 TaxID=2835872 RepID=UPI001BDADE41|nr:methyl-accepting chemotaxis protein [Curvibacter sp. CHRR-16]MBT0569429.1 hypothetical protein [Curvibacter sp. CHRR-16]